jgi:hypothetical protein
MEAKIEERTEAQPLIPQAQGMKPGAKRLVTAIPLGKGRPMRKPKGAKMRIEDRRRSPSPSPKSDLKR